MGLGKQAKTLSKGQVEATLAYLATTRYPERNRLIFLLSTKAGLRAKEIARLTWRMVCDSAGQVADAIHLSNSASKGTSGRVIPMHPEVRTAFIAYRQTLARTPGEYVIATQRMASTSPQVIVNMFQRWYRHLGFVGCSSHSGRRTFITGAARKISTVGGSLRDVQALAGHSNLRTTQRYIEENADAQRRVVQQL
ncbi:site-specific integrase [Bradyrhizobium sp. 155]|uniref:tyrosine-type recombinase/integrase n=1 Tax=unclassified Bradyrhizobium TaxID=2631580 RepID=UPI001FFF5594|nr:MULTISPECIES: site-specific integrase [unclassified Bradyrhizobium]UPK11622.1 site-specific integrase [Bradyrhizobium sp. 155]UPK19526.1 site-specific integrase [Bradyrhizobium sp. 131]